MSLDIDFTFCPSRFDTPNKELTNDFARFRRNGSVVLWTEMTDALRRNQALRDDRIKNWRTLHKVARGDDENAISFAQKAWTLEGEHQVPIVGKQYVKNRPPQRLSLAELKSLHKGERVHWGVAHLPAHLEGDFMKDQVTPETDAHEHMAEEIAAIFKHDLEGPAILCFDGNLDWQKEKVRNYYNDIFAGTGLKCIIPKHGRTHHTLGIRDVDLIWIRGFQGHRVPRVLLNTKSTDHRPQSARLTLA